KPGINIRAKSRWRDERQTCNAGGMSRGKYSCCDRTKRVRDDVRLFDRQSIKECRKELTKLVSIRSIDRRQPMGRKIGRDHSEACPAQSRCNVAPCRPVTRKAMKQHNNACVFGADI